MSDLKINETVTGRIAAVRKLMAADNIGALIVPTGDYHMSEYMAPYFRTREFITGFTGSAGTAVITADEAGLWTDSRYFIQAEKQLEGTGINLFKMREEGVPEIHDYLTEVLGRGSRVSFDGSIVSWKQFTQWKEAFDKAGIEMISSRDLAGEVWDDRPALPCDPVYEYEIRYAGRSRSDKIADIRSDMEAEGADILMLSGLSDIAWLLNLRGSDVHCNPVFLSFVLMDKDNVYLYSQEEAYSSDLAGILAGDGIILKPYGEICDALTALPTDASLWISSAETAALYIQCIPERMNIIDKPVPTSIRKAVKNPVEQECTRQAHIRDGIAVTKWIYWMKSNAGKTEITELSAADKLYSLRSEQPLFMGNSFDPIIAYGEHAAIVHYSATTESDIPVRPEGLLLADTGGQYLDGTTDITRTFTLGPVSEEERRTFTAVLRGHIDLAMAKFPAGINGQNLDVLAHIPLWSMGLDYKHGTGHGVGQFLNVHEGPNSFFWDLGHGRSIFPPFEAGMVTSDEPGYYEEGRYGIRCESLLLCVEDETTPYGRFLRHEELTMVPFDLDAVDADMLTPDEKSFLNSYHAAVYDNLSPHMAPDELEWLREATRQI